MSDKQTRTLSVLEFVDELNTILEINQEFNFSILVEKNPIKKTYTYVCKVLGVVCKDKAGKVFQMMYDKLQDEMLNYIEVKENHTRKVGKRNSPFFIDGCSKLQEFKGNKFIEYCFRVCNNKDIKMVTKIREKFGVDAPKEFKGEALHFDDVMFDDDDERSYDGRSSEPSAKPSAK